MRAGVARRGSTPRASSSIRCPRASPWCSRGSRSPSARCWAAHDERRGWSAESPGDGVRRGRRRRIGMSGGFFTDVPERITYGGPECSDPLSYALYQPDREVIGKRMADHLRIAVCLWHSFNWPGSDVFGVGTFDRPWLTAKGAAACEFTAQLGVPFFTFHDRDVAPEGRSFAETRANLGASVDQIEGHMARTGARLLWGTANLFGPPRHAAGAAT